MLAVVLSLPCGKETFDGDVFIHVFPVDAYAAADESPATALFRGCLAQARKPLQRNRYLTRVRQHDMKMVLCEGDFNCEGFNLN